MASLLVVDRLTVRFGGIVALDQASFEVENGQICGLIGPNGAGKTTLFNCVSRIYTPDEGRIVFDGRDCLKLRPHEVARARIARTFQNLGLFPSRSVLENVMLGAHHWTRANFLTSPLGLPSVRREERRVRDSAMEVLDRLGLTSVAMARADALPYGTLKRVEIARALVAKPRLLMLDEPAGGLTHAEVDELGAVIVEMRDQFDLTIVLVEHHMGLVMRISDTVVALDFGHKIAQGRPEEVQANPSVVEAYLGRAA